MKFRQRAGLRLLPRGSGRVFLAELVDAARRVDHFLLARIERVAVRAHFDAQILAQRRPGFKAVAAGARDFDDLVIGMARGFHGSAGLGSSEGARSLAMQPLWLKGHRPRLSTFSVDNSVGKGAT